MADHDLTGPLNGAPVPLELLEALARGVAAALAEAERRIDKLMTVRRRQLAAARSRQAEK